MQSIDIIRPSARNRFLFIIASSDKVMQGVPRGTMTRPFALTDYKLIMYKLPQLKTNEE